jgi:hypothetical protein
MYIHTPKYSIYDYIYLYIYMYIHTPKYVYIGHDTSAGGGPVRRTFYIRLYLPMYTHTHTHLNMYP